MKVEFNIPELANISAMTIEEDINGTYTLTIGAPERELKLEMPRNVAIKIGKALLKMSGSLTDDDFISRSALKADFNSWKKMDDYYTNKDCDNIPLSEAFDLIDKARPINILKF